MESMNEATSLSKIRAIEELEELHNFISNQLEEGIAKLSLNLDKESTPRVPEDEAAGKIAEQKKSLIDLKGKNALQQDVLRMFLHSREAFKAVYSDIFPVSGEDSALSVHLRSAIREKLIELHQLNEEIYKTQVSKDNLQKKLYDLQLELNCVLWQNKESMKILEHSSEMHSWERMERESEKSFPEVMQAKEDLEKEARSLRTIKHVFQSLIHASKIDWCEDPELSDLVISLGEIYDMRPDRDNEEK